MREQYNIKLAYSKTLQSTTMNTSHSVEILTYKIIITFLEFLGFPGEQLCFKTHLPESSLKRKIEEYLWTFRCSNILEIFNMRSHFSNFYNPISLSQIFPFELFFSLKILETILETKN